VNGREIGWLGALHPAVLSALEIRPQVFAFELALDGLEKREIPSTNLISSYPSVRRDLAIVVPESVNYSEIKALAVETCGALLANLVVFDQFSGKNVETGSKSLAIGLILQDVSCTLTDEVVDGLIDRLVNALATRLDAQLRG
jgi:phenylalanyl-tRNA synthetase beta chain